MYFLDCGTIIEVNVYPFQRSRTSERAAEKNIALAFHQIYDPSDRTLHAITTAADKDIEVAMTFKIRVSTIEKTTLPPDNMIATALSTKGTEYTDCSSFLDNRTH